MQASALNNRKERKKAHPSRGALAAWVKGLVAVVVGAGLSGVHHSERAATVGPDQQHCVLATGNVTQLALYVLRALHLVAIYLQDYVSTADAGIVRRAPWLYVCHDHALHVRRQLQLVAQVSIEVF